VSKMRKMAWGSVLAVWVTLTVAAPVNAAAPPIASCPGQELSAIAPELGSDLGAFVAFEAMNPELEGWRSFGEEISTFALSDRAACPEE